VCNDYTIYFVQLTMLDVLRVFSKIRKEFVEEEAELSGM